MAKFWTSFKRAYRGRTLGKVEWAIAPFAMAARYLPNEATESVHFQDTTGKSCGLFGSDDVDAVCIETPDDCIRIDRHQVEALINHMESWLDYGTLEVRR